jgi:hypothetical protein
MKRTCRWTQASGARRRRPVPGALVLSVGSLVFAFGNAPAWAQQPPQLIEGSTGGAPPQAFVPDIAERSGLVMRYAATPEVLPWDPHRDSFYNTRYADRGVIRHPNWVCSQGLYGLGMKTPSTMSVYPYFYGMPGQSTIDSSSRPWWRPARFFQGLVHPFRPVGMYYSFGSYVPIYDLDPIAPGPGPYPFPFYFNWLHGG